MLEPVTCMVPGLEMRVIGEKQGRLATRRGMLKEADNVSLL
jgi:hypothetical protein